MLFIDSIKIDDEFVNWETATYFSLCPLKLLPHSQQIAPQVKIDATSVHSSLCVCVHGYVGVVLFHLLKKESMFCELRTEEVRW